MLTEAGGVDPSTPLARVIDHVDYVANRIGIDHLGFGSDFDGATVPTELGDASGLQCAPKRYATEATTKRT